MLGFPWEYLISKAVKNSKSMELKETYVEQVTTFSQFNMFCITQ